MSAFPVYSQPLEKTSISILASGKDSLKCDPGPLSRLGIKDITKIPGADLPKSYQSVNLRYKILRYPAADVAGVTAAGVDYERLYDDYIFYFHWPEDQVITQLQERMASVAAGRQLRETIDCEIPEESFVTFRAPFFSVKKGRLAKGEEVLVIERNYYVPADQLAEAVVAPSIEGPSEGAIVALNDSEGVPQIWSQNNYPWVDLGVATTVKQGDQVFALDKITCEPDGNFIVGSIGEVSDEQSGIVVRAEMIAANNYYGASGAPTNVDAVSASVNSKSYWCIPKREFCYQTIPFGDFGIRATVGQESTFPTTSIFSMKSGLVSALQAAVVGQCPQRLMETRKY